MLPILLHMDVTALLKGSLFGFALAAVPGAMCMLCIQRTLALGWWAGVLGGLGTAIADALYGAVAALGLTVVSGFLLEYQPIVRVVGGLMVLWLGYSIFRSKPASSSPKVTAASSLALVFTTFFLTLTNPMTILSFTALIAGAGLAGSTGAGWLVLGFFVGSMLWWMVLATLVRWAGSRLNLSLVNPVAGVVLVGFGAVAIGSVWL